jgi:hypothetical protein
MSVDDYLRELAADPASVMAEGPTGRCRRPLAAVVEASMRRLTGTDESAAPMMRLLAVLARPSASRRSITPIGCS